MDNIIYNTLETYFNILKYTGYRNYTDVYKIVVLQFIQELRDNELRYYITDNDKKAMQDLLYQLFGSTCEISFPQNNINCSCTKPSIDSSTTTSTLPPQAITTTTSTPDPTITTTTSTKFPTTLICNSDYITGLLINGIYHSIGDYIYLSSDTLQVSIEAPSTIDGQYSFLKFIGDNDWSSLDNPCALPINAGQVNTVQVVYQLNGDQTTTTTTTSTTTSTTSSTSTKSPTYLIFKSDHVSEVKVNGTSYPTDHPIPVLDTDSVTLSTEAYVGDYKFMYWALPYDDLIVLSESPEFNYLVPANTITTIQIVYELPGSSGDETTTTTSTSTEYP